MAVYFQILIQFNAFRLPIPGLEFFLLRALAVDLFFPTCLHLMRKIDVISLITLSWVNKYTSIYLGERYVNNYIIIFLMSTVTIFFLRILPSKECTEEVFFLILNGLRRIIELFTIQYCISR